MLWEWVTEHLGFDGHKNGKYYVYELVDPRFSPPRTFYVGKGTENRMYQHAKDMQRLVKTRAGKMKLQPKHKRIIEIRDDGREERYKILFRTDNEAEAYAVESKRIESIGLERLTNETYGHQARTTTIKITRTVTRRRRA